MFQSDDTDTIITSTPTPRHAGSSKSPGRAYSDVRERFARRQQRKLEEARLNNARQTLHVPNELTRSSAFMSPIIQATLKRCRETSHPASALISPTSVTHAIPREAPVVVAGNNSIQDENQEADAEDQKVVSRYPLLGSANIPNKDAPLRGLQGRGSLLDSALFITSCGRHRREEDDMIRCSALQNTSQFVCKTDVNTKKFAYQTFVDAGLFLGRTVTDCTVLSKDVYRLNSTGVHRQRDDDLNFFLHESGNYEEEALNFTLRPSEPLIRNRPQVKPMGVDYLDVLVHTPSRADTDFQMTTDSSDFAQLLHRAHANDIPLLPREARSNTYLDTFRSRFHLDDERKTSSRTVTESHERQETSFRGLGIRLNPKTTSAALRLPIQKLQDDFDLHLDAQRWQLNDFSDYTKPIPENSLYGLPQVRLKTDKELTNGLQPSIEQTPAISKSSKTIFDDETRFTDWDFSAEASRGDNRRTNFAIANVPIELTSLRGGIGKLRAKIAEARVTRLVKEIDKVEAMQDRDRCFTEVSEFKTWVSKVEQQKREIRCQMDNEAQVREMEAKKLRIELDEVRSFLEQKKLIEEESRR